MIATIFETVTQAISGFVGSLTSAVSSIAALFYTPGTDGAAGQMTFLGTLVLIGVGVGIVYWVFRLIRGLIGQRVA
jgi:hypothetical protein